MNYDNYLSVVPKDEPSHPCNPSPCGSNAICKELNGAGSCTCLPDYFGDPYSSCRPECVMNSDCPRDKSCVNNKCKDPCPGTCGLNAECHVNNHVPNCVCLPGFTGNPLSSCRQVLTQPSKDSLLLYLFSLSLDSSTYSFLSYLAIVEPTNPCQPSPCGPFSQCRVVNLHAVCSCQANYVGAPPMCRPECSVSTDCSQDKACINQKCRDPCPGTCGLNARCNVVNHNPICSCPPGQTGDPFVRCLQESKTIYLCLVSIFLFSYLYLFHISRASSDPTKWRSLRAYPLWTKLTMQGCWQSSSMLLSPQLYRSCTQLPSRMYNKCRMSR